MAKKKIKKYRVSADDSMGMAFSVVNQPAVESDFQFFSEQRIEKFVGVEGERRMIYGCALRPDFQIYRNNGKEEYYLEFDKEAIDKISKNYFKMGFQSNWTEAHKDEVEGLTITESWIKESMTQDKSVALGLDPELPIGSWFIGCYCENDDIWNKVKENKYHGFSIEAVVGVEEFESQIDKQNDNNMIDTNETMFWDKMKNVLSEIFSSSSMAKKEDEIEPVDIQDLEAQTEPTAEPQPTEPQPTVEEPKVEEPKPQEEPKQEEPKVEEAPKTDPHLEELINSLKEEVEALKKMNNGLNNKVKELSKQPSAAPVNTNAKPSNGDTYSAWRKQMASYLGY